MGGGVGQRRRIRLCRRIRPAVAHCLGVATANSPQGGRPRKLAHSTSAPDPHWQRQAGGACTTSHRRRATGHRSQSPRSECLCSNRSTRFPRRFFPSSPGNVSSNVCSGSSAMLGPSTAAKVSGGSFFNLRLPRETPCFFPFDQLLGRSGCGGVASQWAQATPEFLVLLCREAVFAAEDQVSRAPGHECGTVPKPLRCPPQVLFV